MPLIGGTSWLTRGIVTISMLFAAVNIAAADVRSPVHGARKGYVDSVKEEPRGTLVEIILVPEEPFSEPSFNDKVFDAKLTKELTQKYESEFGYTEIQRVTQSPSRYADVRYGNGVQVTEEEDLNRRRKFGEYMMRKVTEYHVDKYMKTEPSMKYVYEAKMALQNMNVTVKQGYKLNGNYSLSDNSLTLKLDNPYKVANRLTWQFSDEVFGQETILYMAIPLTKRVTLSGDARAKAESWSVNIGRQMSPTWSANVSASYTRVDPYLSLMENRYLLGLSWVN